MGTRRQSVEELKIQANLLKKSLQSEDEIKKNSALVRFNRLECFADLSQSEMRDKASKIKLKHALEVLAIEQGYRNWADLLAHEDISWYRDSSPFILHWFSDYESAKTHLDDHGGFLLTYRTQYFIGTYEYIEYIGLDPRDPLWQKIGFNTVAPTDTASLGKIKEALKRRAKRRTNTS